MLAFQSMNGAGSAWGSVLTALLCFFAQLPLVSGNEQCNMLWVLGGMTDDFETIRSVRHRKGRSLNQTWLYDPIAKQWKEGPTIEGGTFGAAGAVIGGSLYMVGGRNDSEHNAEYTRTISRFSAKGYYVHEVGKLCSNMSGENIGDAWYIHPDTQSPTTQRPTTTAPVAEAVTYAPTSSPTMSPTRPRAMNLALGKPTEQSDTYPGNGGVSSRAVDGNVNPDWGGSSCTHTHVIDPSWWRVNLTAVHPIAVVRILNRRDCCWDRLQFFEVRISNSSAQNASYHTCNPGGYPYDIPAGGWAEVTCGGVAGELVTIVKPQFNGALTLCEVEVYNTSAASLTVHPTVCPTTLAPSTRIPTTGMPTTLSPITLSPTTIDSLSPFIVSEDQCRRGCDDNPLCKLYLWRNDDYAAHCIHYSNCTAILDYTNTSHPITNDPRSSVKLYKKVGNGWKSLADMSTPPADYQCGAGRYRHAAVAIGHDLYVIGGTCLVGPITYGLRNLKSMIVYSAANGTWSDSVAMPEARAEMAVAVVNQRIYVMGGNSDGLTVNGLQTSLIYDTTTKAWSTGPNLDRERFSAAAVELYGYIYLIGGRGGTNAYTWEGTLDSMIVINPGTNTYTTGTPMLKRRCQHSAASVAGKIYVIGGYEEDSVEVYDPLSLTWAFLPPLPSGVVTLSVAISFPTSIANATNTCPFTLP